MSDPTTPAEPRPADASRVRLAMIAELSHTNPFGTIHGGVILRLADECGALAALRHAGGPAITTAALDSMAFLSPVHVGELLEIVAEVTYVGRTSLEARIDVHAEEVVTRQRRKVAAGFALYVALDDAGRPRPVPPLLLATDDDRAQHAAAAARQAARLARRSEARGEGQ